MTPRRSLLSHLAPTLIREQLSIPSSLAKEAKGVALKMLPLRPPLRKCLMMLWLVALLLRPLAKLQPRHAVARVGPRASCTSTVFCYKLLLQIHSPVTRRDPTAPHTRDGLV